MQTTKNVHAPYQGTWSYGSKTLVEALRRKCVGLEFSHDVIPKLILDLFRVLRFKPELEAFYRLIHKLRFDVSSNH